MSYIEKEKLIKADIASIENRVRHAFNQGYDLGYKEGKANCSEKPIKSETKIDCDNTDCNNCINHKYCDYEPTTTNDLAVAEMIRLVRESDVIDRTDGSVLAKAFNYLFDRYIEEPTAKNDLGVERQIKEICISYPKSDLKEHDGQPYYSVNYIENGEEYEGYGTYKIEVLMEYLRNYFMPSVTPQLSSELEKNSKKLEKDFGELDCISRQAVLDLIADYDLSMGQVVRGIHALPSVTPQEPRWIPVSDYLPVTNDEVLVTYIVNGNHKKRYVETARCFDGEWSSINDEYRIPNTKIEIIAWCEMPKPYREVEE